MPSYDPPYRDIAFVIDELLGAPAVLAQLEPFRDLDEGTVEQVVREAGRFSKEVLQPLNATGDIEGCEYRDGKVSTPKGFADAYARFAAAGWPALGCAPEFGGQGLPGLLNVVLFEMLTACNHAWSMYPGLLQGAYRCLRAHGSAELQQRFLGKLVSGEWLSTMCLTEAHAGSDLGLLRTRAERHADGSYRLHGTKIFISGGEQDMTANIVHLVLARLPGAPQGTAGISLFLVPKMIEDPQGQMTFNALRCDGIEHKMGIRGSATCTMSFEGAQGWLVGEENRGLACMFVMMNAARLHVGICGLGLAEVAHQNALAYAKERRQMKAVPRPPEALRGAADPIFYHASVRRLLLGQKALIEGGRALAYWTALLLDLADHHADAAVREECEDLVSLLTPVLKAFLTQSAFTGASDAVQVLGGHGYIRDSGIEQFLRDARITMIYEGTNEIQAVDLVKRKVLADGGRRLERLLSRIDEEVRCAKQSDAAATLATRLASMAARLRAATAQIASRAARDEEAPYRVAGEYLHLVAHCALACFWCMAARVAGPRAAAGEPFHAAKLATANHYFTYLAPEATRCAEIIAQDEQALTTEIP
jgi:alkylation response protein AidB-like acyl-CoA dehydrogenase